MYSARLRPRCILTQRLLITPLSTQPRLATQCRTAVSASLKHMQNNDKYHEYRDKLTKKAKELGLANLEELKEKYKDTLEQQKSEFNKIDPLKELHEFEKSEALKAQQKFSEASSSPEVRSPRDPTIPEKPFKTLNSFIDVSKILNLNTSDIQTIWKERFKSVENSLISIIESPTFDKLYKNARENPIFVLPLPRPDQGVELHYIQWSFVGPNTVHCMITTLLEFKTHREFARPHMSLMFHSELKEAKGVVLMNGTLEKESSVSLQDAQLLLLNIQRFYGALLTESDASKRRFKLLRDFTLGSSDFSVDDLVKEAESLEN